MSAPTNADEPQYLTFLEDVKSRIQYTQIRIVNSANRELINKTQFSNCLLEKFPGVKT